MKFNSAIAIIGPTGVGKTAVAFELARRVGVGELVNIDKIFLFKHFPISSGLADALREKGVKRHLYELLDPQEEIIPVPEYIAMIRKTCAGILSAGGLPIVEGGSTTYIPGFIVANRKEQFCAPIIGLRLPVNFNFELKFRERLDDALRAGLLEEIKNGLKNYRDTLVMKDCHAIVPLVRYIDGAITLEEAKAAIIDRATQYAQFQLKTFSQYPEVTWFDYEPRRLSETVDRIIKML